jgi:hypothetical protein
LQRKAELAVVVEEDNRLMEEFNALVPTNHEHRVQLLKSYRRNIKRKKACMTVLFVFSCWGLVSVYANGSERRSVP